MALQFRFKHGVEQRHEGEDLLLADQRGRALRITQPSQPLLTILQRLDEGGGTLPSLMQGTSSLAPFITLQELEQRGWLALELVSGEQSLVTLEPQSTALKRTHPPSAAVCVRWSRFVQITPEAGGVLLEGPLQGARLSLQHAELMPLIWKLAGPSEWPTALRALPQAVQEQGDDLLMLLLTSGVAGMVGADGTPSCDHQANQQRWSREDLSLHHRSRDGWTERKLGGTFPGAVRGPAPPLLHQGAARIGGYHICPPVFLYGKHAESFLAVSNYCSRRPSSGYPFPIQSPRTGPLPRGLVALEAASKPHALFHFPTRAPKPVGDYASIYWF